MSGDVETQQSHTRHHPFFYIGGVFLNAVLFAAVGPPIGGAALTTFTSVLRGESIYSPFVGLAGYVLFFFATVPASYFYAGPSALVTGAIVAVISIWMTYTRYLYVAAALTGAVVSALFLSRYEYLTRGQSMIASVVAFAISGALSAVVCTRAAKPFRLGVPPGPPLASSLPADTT